MSDLTDVRLAELVHWASDDGYGGMPDTHQALLELQRRRERHAADRAAVQAVLAAQDANVGRLIVERDAARRARLVSEMTLRDAHAERDAARAECERMRQECNDAADRDAELYRLREAIVRLRSLLAVEPTVSEEQCREIDGRAFEASHDALGEVRWFRMDAEPTRVYWSPVIDGRDTCVPQSYADMFRAVDAAFAAAANPRAVRYLIAGYRQLLALRAELARIADSIPHDAHDKSQPTAWAVTWSRVTAFVWIAERLAGSAMDPERDREAAQIIAGMLSETAP